MRLVLCRVSAIFTLAMQLQACTTWKPGSRAPRQLLAEQKPKVVRATLHDGRRMVIARPSIVGDSILGAANECRPSDLEFGSPACRTMMRPMVELGDLQRLEVRRTDPVRSALAVGAAVAVGRVLLMVLVMM